jgi:hypothetical protein
MVAVPASLAGGGEEAAAAVSAALRTAMRPFENTNANAPADSDMYAPPTAVGSRLLATSLALSLSLIQPHPEPVHAGRRVTAAAGTSPPATAWTRSVLPGHRERGSSSSTPARAAPQPRASWAWRRRARTPRCVVAANGSCRGAVIGWERIGRIAIHSGVGEQLTPPFFPCRPNPPTRVVRTESYTYTAK